MPSGVPMKISCLCSLPKRFAELLAFKRDNITYILIIDVVDYNINTFTVTQKGPKQLGNKNKEYSVYRGVDQV